MSNYSYWENSELVTFDTIIVGGGLFGLSVGCHLLERDRHTRKVCILERGLLPAGASTKNGGFGCIASMTEFLDEVDAFGVTAALDILKDRWRGLQLLMRRVDNDPEIVHRSGSYEVFKDAELGYLPRIGEANAALRSIFGGDVFTLQNDKIEELGLNKNVVKALVHKDYEWQINSGRLVNRLIKRFTELGGRYLTGTEVTDYKSISRDLVELFVKNPIPDQPPLKFYGKRSVFCLNSFIQKLVKGIGLFPVKEEVMVTKPIEGLKLVTNLETDRGYYYIRPVNGRILIGGGPDSETEGVRSFDFVTAESAQQNFVEILTELFPGLKFEPDYTWSGIMGFSEDRKRCKLINVADNVLVVFGCTGLGVSLASVIAERVYDTFLKELEPKL